MKQSRFILVSVAAVILLIILAVALVVLLNPSISPITVFAVTETSTPMPTATSTATFTPIPPTATFTETSTPTASHTPTSTATPTPKVVTATLLPTLNVTPSPTLTPSETPFPRVIAQVVADIAVYRSGPGKAYPVMSRFKRGITLQLIGISEDKAWYLFRYENSIYWISGGAEVTKILEGDPLLLPVLATPPTPVPGPKANVDQLDWRYCVFDNNMSEEAQNNLVDQMHTSANNDDWATAGSAARRLYLCAAQAAFYVVYAQVYQNKTAVGEEPMEMTAALSQFLDGWNGNGE